MRPTFSSSLPRYTALVGVVLALSLETRASSAQTTNTARTAGPVVSVKAQAGHLLEYTVCNSAATFSLDVSTGSPSMVELPRGFDKYLHADHTTWVVKRDGNKLYIAVPEDEQDQQAEPEFSVRIRATKPVSFEASLHARIVGKVRGVDDNVLIHHQQDKKRFGKQPEENPCVARVLSPLQRLRIRAFDRQQGEARAIGVPEIANVVRSGSGFPIELSMYEMEAGNLVVDFNATNRHATTAEVTGVRVMNTDGKELPSKIWYWEEDGRPITETKLAIAGFEDVRASIHIPNADKHDLEPMLIEFRGTKGASPFMTTVQVGTFRHMTPEEIAQMKRDEEQRRKNEERKARELERNRRARQISIVVRGVAGGFWLTSGAETGVMSATSTRGAALRITKGIFPILAFEGELVGGQTGAASFENVSWNDMQGDISRSASFARLQGAVVVRFGEQYIVSTRVGIGVQAASYESAFEYGNARMAGPGDSVEVGLFTMFGASLDTRLGDHWTVGVGGSLSQAFDGPRALEAGVHAGYRWMP